VRLHTTRSTSAALILAGGPSLAGFDFARLPNFYRIGANQAAWLADCDAFVTIDGRFERGFQHNIRTFKGLKFSSARPISVTDDVIRCDTGPEGGLSHSFPLLHGRNSGHAAVNVAVLLGFQRIYLLGFDFTSGDQSHWHAVYSWGARSDIAAQYVLWSALLDACAADLASRSVTVINVLGAAPSSLTAYPTTTLTDLCAEAANESDT